MAYAYVNGWSNSANGNTVTVSPSAGNLLVMHVVTSLGGGDPTWTCDDNLTSGGYTVAFAAAAGTSTYRHGSGYKLNVASGVTTLTFTFNGGNPGEIFIKVFEYSGIATSSAYIGGVRNFQSAPGTSTDALTSTAYNVASGVPALVAAVCAHDWHDSTPSAGTGWTSRYATGTRLEDVRATSTGNQTATFTAVNGTLDYCTILMAFSEPASGTTLYFLDSAASGSNFGQLQVGGSAPSTATTATGWTVDTVGATNYALMAYASERASTVFSGTAQPAGNPDNSLGDCFRSTSTMSGDFATGVWTIAVPVIAVSAAAGQDGRVRVRLWKSSNATGTSPTEITSGAVAGTTVTNLTTGAEQVSTVTTGSITGFSMANEYLFVQIAWEITGAAT